MGLLFTGDVLTDLWQTKFGKIIFYLKSGSFYRKRWVKQYFRIIFLAIRITAFCFSFVRCPFFGGLIPF